MRRDSDQSGYLPYIDGLRAVAVLAVVAYHLDSSWLPGGFVGVDIFFVISGFVVSASVDRLDRTSPVASMLRFYARRIRRIAPALVTCLLVTCVASAMLIPAAWLSDASLNTGQAAFFGLSNWVIASTGDDYFSPRAEFNPYLHTWSLGVEEQFYLIFPLLFLAWSWGGGRRWLSVALFGFGCALSLAYVTLASRGVTPPTHVVYVSTSRFWQLAAGVLLFQGLMLAGVRGGGAARSEGAWARLRSAGIFVSSLLIGVALVFARPGRSPWPDGFLPVIGTAGILGLIFASTREGWVARSLSVAPMVRTGRVSYSLYLWHWPVFVLFRWTTGLEDAWPQVTALALAVGLAVLSYHLVERPLRYAEPLVRMPDRRFVAAAALVIVALGLGYRGLTALRSSYSLSVVTRHAEDWYPSGGMRDPVSGCEVQVRREGTNTVYARAACDAPRTDSRHLFVAGDSHAAAYAEMLKRFTLLTGAGVTIRSVTECPRSVESSGSDAGVDCQAWVEQTLAEVAAAGRAEDLLFLPRKRLARLSEQWDVLDSRVAGSTLSSAVAAEERASGEAAALAALRPLADRGIRIIIEAPKPVFRAPAFRCSDWFNRGNAICAGGLSVESAFLERYRAPVLESVRRVAAELPGASVWDPFPVLCPGAVCSAAAAGRPLFFDGDHLSGHANRILLPSFLAHVSGLPR